MFRVITCNTNGIRAAQRKGFFEWLAKQDADVVCIQETKAQEHQLVDEAFRPDGYHCYYNDGQCSSKDVKLSCLVSNPNNLAA